MATHASSRSLTFCSRSPPQLSNILPLSKPAATMGPGAGCAGGAGAGGRDKNPPPQGVHPRYVPKRGAVLKGIVRGVLRAFLLASAPGDGLANSGGRRVRPAPSGAGGDGAAQGK